MEKDEQLPPILNIENLAIFNFEPKGGWVYSVGIVRGYDILKLNYSKYGNKEEVVGYLKSKKIPDVSPGCNQKVK